MLEYRAFNNLKFKLASIKISKCVFFQDFNYKNAKMQNTFLDGCLTNSCLSFHLHSSQASTLNI